MLRRLALLLAAACLLAGCGEEAAGEGSAQLWVTRDRGAELLVDAKVEAGQTLLRALAAETEVETRYGGRYVGSTGDGLFATFDGPARAVACAQAIARAVADLGIQILGGMGYSAEYQMQRYWRDVRLYQIGPVTNQMVRNIVAESVGLPRSF